jgi:hypothetical protein
MEAIDSSGKERMISLIVLTVTGEKGIPFYVIQKKKTPCVPNSCHSDRTFELKNNYTHCLNDNNKQTEVV